MAYPIPAAPGVPGSDALYHHDNTASVEFANNWFTKRGSQTTLSQLRQDEGGPVVITGTRPW
jgi:hypothetical protein